MKELPDGGHECQLVKQEVQVKDGEPTSVIQKFRIPGVVGTVGVEHKLQNLMESGLEKESEEGD